MFDDKIVVIRRNTSGHNYTMGSYYTLGKAAPIGPNASVRLAPLFKPVNRIGHILPSGNTIKTADFDVVDVFGGDDTDFMAFLKAKQTEAVAAVVAELRQAVTLKENIRKITEFSSKEEYILSRIKDCKDSLEGEPNDDAQSKEIVTLLASLV